MTFPIRPSPLTSLSLDQARLARAQADSAPHKAGKTAQTELNSKGNDQAGLRQVANQFEALFLGQLIRAMRSTVPENSFWGQDGGSKIYRQLHDQALADSMAGSNTLGIAELIVRQFEGSVDSANQPIQAKRGGAPLRLPPLEDPRGLSAYKRHAAVPNRAVALARLRDCAALVGGAAADSLQRWQRELSLAAETVNLDPALVLAVMVRESGGDPLAVSPRGAQGLMQLMPGTARELGVADPADPLQNLLGGSRYLANMMRRYKGDLDLALAAYNAGPGTVDRLGGRVPNYPETRRYIAAVKDLARRLGAETGTDLVRSHGNEAEGPMKR